MRPARIISSGMAVIITAASIMLSAAEVTLNGIQFPEKYDVSFDFKPTTRLPDARMDAKVEYKEGQAWINVSFKNMKAAVLFGGDITSYVMWAITRDGSTENLGELWVTDEDDSLEFTTGEKNFALMVTAEPYFLVDQPSELVIFTSMATDNKRAHNMSFTFSNFGPTASYGNESIARVDYTGDTPLDLLQAEKAYELAGRMGAQDYAPMIYRDARIKLSQARNLAKSSGQKKGRIDYCRRSVAFSTEAMRVTTRKKEAEELARLIAQRKAEMEALKQRAEEAEALRLQAEKQMAEMDSQMLQVKTTLAQISTEKDQIQSEITRLSGEKTVIQQTLNTIREEKAALETAMTTLVAEKAELEKSKAALMSEKEQLELQTANLKQQAARLEEKAASLQKEKETLSKRLEGALSEVAETKSSARGFIVNLPDILFDVNKAELKPEAKITIAKLAGILLILPEQNLRIEGHTDSTGGAAHNLRLSQKRADSVFDFLHQQGIKTSRMKAAGYGMDRPVADNDTSEGRARNRRVEIIIAEGIISD